MNKIDFALVISARKCNPNGDPTYGNMPRQDLDGHGEISDVCIKRKIRDRIEECGEKILITKNELLGGDGFYSIKDRVDSVSELKEYRKNKDYENFLRGACKTWYDVRAFGQVLPYKKPDGVAIGIRGPVSVGIATTLEPVCITRMEIVKSTNWEGSGPEKDSTTMGLKCIIDKGAYVCYGGIYPQIAKITGFNEDDVQKLKNAMMHLLDNDASSCRPIGSMSSTLFWAEHDTECGNLLPQKVHELFGIRSQEEWPYFSYDVQEVDNIKIEVY